jgi:tetratricopeptide (TPR) repeat protein
MKFFLPFNILILVIVYSCQEPNLKKGEEMQVDSIIKITKNKKVQEQIRIYDSLLTKKFNDKELRAKLYFELGKGYFDLIKYDKAILYFKKALKTTGNELFKGRAAVNLSYSYVDKDQKDKALDYAHMALNIARKNQDSQLRNLSLQALSKIYYYYGDLDKSAEMIQQVLEEQKKNHDSTGMSASYSNLGIIYFNNKKYKEAFQSTLKSLELDKKNKDKLFLAVSYNNLGAYGTMLNMNPDSIISWYNKAIAIKKRKGVPYVDELINIAYVYTKENKFDKAKKLLNRALELSTNITQKKSVYDYYMELALKQKDIEKINEYLTKRDSIIKELEKIKNEEKVKLLQQNYKLNLQKAQLENKEAKLKKNIFLYTSLILILILSIIIAALAYVNKNLKFKQEKMQLQQKLFSAQLNPHFIFNSLTALQNSLIRETPLRAITYLSRFAKLIRRNFDMVSKETVSLKDELSLLNDFVEMQKIRDIHDFDFLIELDPAISPTSTLIPPLLLQPLIENSIEHGFTKMERKGQIQLKITENKNKICFEVIDNGVGFKENEEDSDERVHALDILRERIKLFNEDKDIIFKIKRMYPGTRVFFCIDKKEI